jgi:hypothetical protein
MLLANDGLSSTFWKHLTTDTDKWWAVDLGATYSLNRIRLIFPQTSTWKYKLEVSGDNSTWQKVIDQSDNAIAGSAFNSTGNLGENIRYVRVYFGNNNAALAEINIYGTDKPAEKKHLISGTVIGTKGSWNNNTAVTKEYVFDSNVNTFFDAPSGSAWVGLDLGTNNSFQIDSIRYHPREGSEHQSRMQNGVFEISNNSDF